MTHCTAQRSDLGAALCSGRATGREPAGVRHPLRNLSSAGGPGRTRARRETDDILAGPLHDQAPLLVMRLAPFFSTRTPSTPRKRVLIDSPALDHRSFFRAAIN